MSEPDLAVMTVEEKEAEYEALKAEKKHNTHRGKALRESLQSTPGIEIGTAEGEASQDALEEALAAALANQAQPAPKAKAEPKAETKTVSGAGSVAVSMNGSDNGERREFFRNVWANHIAMNGFKRKALDEMATRADEMFSTYEAALAGGDCAGIAEEKDAALERAKKAEIELASYKQRVTELTKLLEEYRSTLRAHDLPF